jgi:hypothetical protein
VFAESFFDDGVGLDRVVVTPLMNILIRLSLGSLTMMDILFLSEVKRKEFRSSNFFSLPLTLMTV